jgi:hypothetical protein
VPAHVSWRTEGNIRSTGWAVVALGTGKVYGRFYRAVAARWADVAVSLVSGSYFVAECAGGAGEGVYRASEAELASGAGPVGRCGDGGVIAERACGAVYTVV